MKKVVIVILNFKVVVETIKCIKSVQASTYPNLQIIVVDNNSGDGLGEKLKVLKDTYFFQNDKNLGYTGGNNIGIKLALGLGADYVYVLNPDTKIEKDCIENLVKGLEKTGAGIVGPKIYFMGTTHPSSRFKTIWHAGGTLDMLNVIGGHRGVDEVDKGQYEKQMEVDFVSGAALFIKKEVFEKIGFFDDGYFLYYEDSDFCIRAKGAGFKVVYIPSAVVYHENAKSSGLGSPLQDYFLTRNRMIFASKFLPFRTRFALFREAVRNIGNPRRRLALFDFLIGNFGKGSFKI